MQWQRITDQAISNDGKWVVTKSEPWSGDAMIQLFDAKGNEVASYAPADRFNFAHSSNYLLVRRTPAKALTDSLKLKKTKADDMPMNSLLLRHLSGKEEVIDSVRGYALAESADWMAYQRNRKDSTLYVRSLDGTKRFQFPSVKEYKFAEKSGRFFYITGGDTVGTKPGLYTLDVEKGNPVLVKEGSGVFKQTTFNKAGDAIAFLYCADKDSAGKALDLWLAEKDNTPRLVAERTNEAFPAGWVISENGQIRFSENNARLFFGTAPEPKQKDTTMLAEDRSNVQVWSWDEPVQYTVQTFNKASDLKRSYQAVYSIAGNKLIQLTNPEIPTIMTGDEGNAELAIISTSLPYSVSSMWESRSKSDYYTVSLATGERKLLLEADYGRLRLSPKGKYAWWYASTDSSYYTISLADGKLHRLTTPQSFPAWDTDNDVPDYPSAYGSPGWTANDEHILIYDRYDIWRFDPKGNAAPVNLTRNGRSKEVNYRYVSLDREERFIDLNKTVLLRAFNEQTKGTGVYSTRLSSAAEPKALLTGDFTLNKITKAKQAEVLIYSQESFEQYPDIQLTDMNFRSSVRLTNGIAQQEGVNWGTTELVSWISLDGIPLQGVIYKPSDFDPNKKYPLLVNFYERNAETLHTYRMPEPHRSTIDYHLHLSNGYVVFNPDIVYKEGYPGESCFNAIMPGISLLLEKGYIDEKAIGAQGHSWGGYQVAYLATRTNLFAAIESGAPVVNMFSAYGGIRWGSGLNRSFQYEHGQSRIGGTPWTTPLRYVENSPLFTMDKVETPILIMHNDEDGHVPWYQGIEYFVALKRLQKPVWMLNYTGEPHWPTKTPNKIDFQKRMMQFFNHYLKGAPMPKWMEEGVPAVEQEFEGEL